MIDLAPIAPIAMLPDPQSVDQMDRAALQALCDRLQAQVDALNAKLEALSRQVAGAKAADTP